MPGGSSFLVEAVPVPARVLDLDGNAVGGVAWGGNHRVPVNGLCMGSQSPANVLMRRWPRRITLDQIVDVPDHLRVLSP